MLAIERVNQIKLRIQVEKYKNIRFESRSWCFGNDDSPRLKTSHWSKVSHLQTWLLQVIKNYVFIAVVKFMIRYLIVLFHQTIRLKFPVVHIVVFYTTINVMIKPYREFVTIS